MKKIFLTILTAAISATSFAQTNATNWTATDCSGASHTLFDELNSGKIIVFTWVMPCGSCISGAKAAYNAVQTFAASHPGKVVFYLADDLGDDNCAALTSWINTNSIGNTSNMTVFGNSGIAINENNFGGSGMPHTVVMGGTDHKIYYNKKNAATNDQSGIESAVNSAISAVGIQQVNSDMQFAISPNPVTDVVSIATKTGVSKVVITSLTGTAMREESYNGSKTNVSISLNGLAAGVYTITVTDRDGQTGIRKIVKE